MVSQVQRLAGCSSGGDGRIDNWFRLPRGGELNIVLNPNRAWCGLPSVGDIKGKGYRIFSIVVWDAAVCVDGHV